MKDDDSNGTIVSMKAVNIMDKKLNLKQQLNKLGIADAESAEARMLTFMRLVLERNETINLTSITGEDEFIDKHFLDSVACYGWPEIEAAEHIVDVGTGAGFPGVPLAIVYPEKRFLLIDSLGKRIDFLREATAAMKLENISVLHSRAEDAGRNKEFRERFDLCVSRAVGNLSVLSEYCLPFVKVGGRFYAYKTLNAVSEIEDSCIARELLGGASAVDVRTAGWNGCPPEAATTGVSGHNIMVMKKVRPTPRTYPRKAGTPGRVPL
ncbi:MAG: 16S rRNA (guanine(527)-N(7))-methyltransferase RsmG [Clostridiales Family XIII bacterium]|jgi:16S rRNA (guanine527-N7)-methyltransferase|nr:16S rRNA (guanine(527)-N(7))-methyltransferase RsmG [Clostridiales Family XIII bacterium]